MRAFLRDTRSFLCTECTYVPSSTREIFSIDRFTRVNALCTLHVIIYGSRGWRVGGSVRGSFYIGGGIDEEGGADDEG